MTIVSDQQGYPVSASLAELASTANAEHEAIGRELRSCMAHAIKAGTALLQAQQSVGRGEWSSWVAANLIFGPRQAGMYMRAAFYREELETSALALNATNERQLRDAMSWLPSRPATWAHRRVTPELREHVRQRRESGLTWRAIGRELGVHHETVHCWADPEYEKRVRSLAKEQQRESQRRARQRRKLIDQLERQQANDQLVSEAGGDISKAYAEIRRALSHLDKCLGSYEGEAHRRLVNAIHHCHRAEDDVVATLRIERTS